MQMNNPGIESNTSLNLSRRPILFDSTHDKLEFPYIKKTSAFAEAKGENQERKI